MNDAKVTIERELELIDGMIEVQLHHAEQCGRIANRTMAEKQKGWDMERVALLRKMRAALAAQPAEPVALDNTCMTEQVIDEYLSDYTMDGDSEFHMPSESELALIKDAIMGLLVDPNFLAAFAPLTEPELRAGIALQLREIERLRVQVKQADERGDDAMRRAHGAEAQIEALAEAQAFLMTELAAAKEKHAAAQHAADCLEAKCSALEADYNRRPENEPIGMLLDFLSTRPRNIIRVELAGLWRGEELTLGHLCKFTRSEVLRFPNLGKKSLREIEEYFRPRGVWWRGEA